MLPRWAYVILLLIYAVAVGVITLRPIPGETFTATWVPFAEIWHLLTDPEAETYLNLASVAGNVALFVPLGWLLPMIWRQLRSVKRVVIVAAACSITIELIQYGIPGRTPTTDDVLLNVAGGLIGAIMFLAPQMVE